VSGILSSGSPTSPSPGRSTVGFCGKLPARGDFVRSGLPREFTDPWDAWLQAAISGSRALMGETWLAAFLEAPVWRFSLPPGMCGAQTALGLMLPSVDRAGRYFPLTFAALSPHGIAIAAGESWLDACEAAGRAALEQDTPPQDIAAMLDEPELPDDVIGTDQGIWWSEGSTRVAPTRMMLRRLPDAATYAAMLGAEAEGPALAEMTWQPTP